LARIPVKQGYAVEKLNQHLQQKAGSAIESQNKTTGQPKEEMALSPTCPKCGADMVHRIAKKGTNAGKVFWGCSNYPRCRGIVNVTDSWA